MKRRVRNNMKRRVWSVLLVIVILLGMMPTIAMAAGTSLPVNNDAAYTEVDIDDMSMGSATLKTFTVYLQSSYGKVYVDSATQDGTTFDIVLRADTDPTAALQFGFSGTGTSTLSYTKTCALVDGSCSVPLTIKAMGQTVGTATINFTTASSGSEEPPAVEVADPIEITMTFASGGQIVEVEGEKIYNVPVVVYDNNEDGKLTIGEAFAAFHEAWYDGENGYAETSNDSVTGWVTNFWGQGSSRFSYALNYGWVKSTQEEIEDGDQLAAYFGQAADYLDLLTWFDQNSYEVQAGEEKEFSVNGISIYKSGETGDATAVPGGATVTVYDSNGDAVVDLATITDANGKFSVNFPEAGSYSIVVSGTCDYTCNGVTTDGAPVVPAYCEVIVEAAEEPEEIVLSGSCTGYDVSFAVTGATVKSAKTTPNGNSGVLELVVTDVTGNVVVTPTFTKITVNAQYLAIGGNKVSLDVTSGSANSTAGVMMIVQNRPIGQAGTWTIKVTVADYVAPTTLTFTTDLSEAEVKYTEGDTSTALTVAAEQSKGAAVTYQWYKNTTKSTTGATAIEGATSASYTPSTAEAGTTYYYAVATCGDLTATSKIAAVVVEEAETEEEIILTATGSDYTISFEVEGATVVSAKPAFSGKGGTLELVVEDLTGTEIKVSPTVSGGPYDADVWFVNVSIKEDGTGKGSFGIDDVSYGFPTGTVGSWTVKVTVADYEAPATLRFTADLSETAVTYTEGDTATALTVAAEQSKGETVTYQWYKNTTKGTEGATVINGAAAGTYTPSTEAAGTTYYYVVASCGELTATSKMAEITVVPAVSGEEPDDSESSDSVTVNYSTSNGSLDSIRFEDAGGNPIQVSASVDGTNINVQVPRSLGVSGKIKAIFSLTQNADGLPFITTKTGASGTSSGKAVNNKFTDKTTTLSSGMATFTFYYYNTTPRVTNNSYTTFNLNYAMSNNAPVLTGADSMSDSITAGDAYELDVASLFRDPDGDNLTYKISVNNAAAVEVDARYSYTAMDAGTHTLVFTAQDTYGGVSETYTLTLEVANSTATYDVTVNVPDSTAPTFYFTEDAAEGTELTATATGNVYTVKVPENVSTISWRYDDMGMSAAVSAENNSLTLVRTKYIVMAGENIDTAAVVTVKYGDLTAHGKNNIFLLLSTGTYTVEAKASASNTAGWRDVSLSNKGAVDGEDFIDLESKEISFVVPYFAELTVYRPATSQGVPPTAITPTTVGEPDYASGTKTCSYILTNNTVYAYRVSVPETNGNCDQYVTFVGMFKKTDSTGTITVSRDQIEDGTNGRKTIDHELEPYTNGSLDSANVADLYLNVNAQGYLKMSQGTTKNLYAARAWWATNCGGWAMSTYYYLEPDYHFTVVGLDGQPCNNVVTVDENGKITAVGNGTAIVLVTYDAMNTAIDEALFNEAGPETPRENGFYSAIWPENTGVFVVSVGADDSGITTGMTINESKNTGKASKYARQNIDAEHDVIYFLGDQGEYTFTPATAGVTVSVANPTISGNELSFSGFRTVSANADGSVTVPLTQGRNIVKVAKGDSAEYQVITAKNVSVTVNGQPLDEAVVAPGDSVKVVFSTIYNPVNRLCVYNTGAAVVYQNVSGYEGRTAGNFNGGMGFYFFASNAPHQTVANFNEVGNDGSSYGNYSINLKEELTVPADFEGEYFSLTDGSFYVSGFSRFTFGQHREVMGQAPGSGSSNNIYAYFGTLPDIQIRTTNYVEPEEPVILTGIAVTTQPAKTTYTVGESFDPAGMIVTATYSDDSTKAVTDYTYDTAAFTTAGSKTVTITYTEGDVTKTAAVTVTVEEAEVPVTLTGIAVTTQPAKTTYTVGESFDPAGMIVTATYSDDSTKAVTDYTYDTAAFTTVGSKTVTITYTEGDVTKATAVTVTVEEAEVPVTLTGIAVTTQPAKTTYTVGESFDPAGMIVTATYSDGTTETVTDYTYPTAALSKTTKTVTISYGGATAAVAITMNVVEKIAVTTKPTKTTYTVGETFDPAGMVVAATYTDGTTKEITTYKYAPTAALTLDDTTVVITYTGDDSIETKRTSLDITIEKKTETEKKSISVNMSFISAGNIEVYNVPVTVIDEDGDGKYTVSNAFVAFHEACYSGGASGYAEISNASLTGWVTMFWGKGASGLCYVVNNSWVSSTQIGIHNGSSISAFFCKDMSTYSDLYTWFSADSYSAVAGKEMTLTVNGMNVMGSGASGDLNAAPKGAAVTVYDKMGKEVSSLGTTVDTNGQFTITFTEAGTYTVEVSGTTSYGNYSNAPVVPSRCTVRVTEDKATGGKPDKDQTGTTGLLFSDIRKSDYYYDAVTWAVEQGITTGTTSTTFAPNANCTRAQMVTFLWRAAGQPAAGDVRMTFKDVDRNAYYYQALLWAISEGITTGVSETSFAPNATCTRAQMVTFLYRMASKPVVTAKHGFEDVSAEDYYNTAVAWAVQQGITTGMTKTTFAPAASCTRGQTVTFLYRMLAEKRQ